MIYNGRTSIINDAVLENGDYVLYWMQQAQRAEWNHALERAITVANNANLPVLAAFGITQRFPGANERHYAFMLEGLRDTKERMAKRGIPLIIRLVPPVKLVSQLAPQAAAIVADRGYLDLQRRWRERVASRTGCRFVEVDTDAVVPVHRASSKEEYAARTIRPKIRGQLNSYLEPVRPITPRHRLDSAPCNTMELEDIDGMLEDMRISRSGGRVSSYRGGYTRATRRLEAFIETALPHYNDLSRDPNADCASHLSPYLHFGQISPVEIALKIQDADEVEQNNIDAFLEQLIVRRELALNFCWYNPDYDSFDCLPEWAQDTLMEHRKDPRPYSYTEDELESAETHDPYWNAAQMRMMTTGYMHNYMRMYWGKKILEWMESPRTAFQTALKLNNRYELDGRDPCSFANVAWCFGKHDQGWKERDIFGKVRYMNARGLERKFDMDQYLSDTEDMLRGERG
ncbi:MAG: deoxyribodipyrimidine photo-lyase [Planctomycetota bacterium]